MKGAYFFTKDHGCVFITNEHLKSITKHEGIRLITKEELNRALSWLGDHDEYRWDQMKDFDDDLYVSRTIGLKSLEEACVRVYLDNKDV